MDFRLRSPHSFGSGCVIDTRHCGGTVARPARCQDTYLLRVGMRIDHLFCWECFVESRQGEGEKAGT